jgi:predicted nucleic acid-binding protein
LIVVDASVLVEILLLTREGLVLGERLLAPASSLCAPELIDVEVAQIVRRYERLGDLSAARGAAMLEDLADFPLERYTHRPLLARMWELRPNITAYDAAYVALAEVLEAPLLTRDGRLARTPHGARVELV